MDGGSLCDLGFLCSISDRVLSTPPMEERQLRLIKKATNSQAAGFPTYWIWAPPSVYPWRLYILFNTVIMVIIYRLSCMSLLTWILTTRWAVWWWWQQVLILKLGDLGVYVSKYHRTNIQYTNFATAIYPTQFPCASTWLVESYSTC